MEELHILIIGSGSVGQRHAANFSKMGCKISLVDPIKDRMIDLSSDLTIKNIFISLDHALKKQIYSGAVICSPTAYHINQAIDIIKSDTPLLMEKPIGIDLECKIFFTANLIF